MRPGFLIRASFCLTLLVTLGVFAQASEAQEGTAREYEVVSNLRVRNLEAEPAAGIDEISLQFTLDGSDYDVLLTRTSIFSSGARNVWTLNGQQYRELSGGDFYSGVVAGRQGAVLRVRIDDGSLEGLVITPDQIYFLEPARRRQVSAQSDLTLAYRLSDIRFSDELECGFEIPEVGHEDRWIEGLRAEPIADSLGFGGAALREIEIRLFVDSHYFQRHGPDSAIRVQTLVHSANAFYEPLGITFRVAETSISLSRADDGLSDTLDAIDLLNEFSHSGSVGSSDVAHLMTGRDLDGSTIGMAWRASLCDPNFAVGLSQDLLDPASRAVLMAHELGHNIGAAHDGSPGTCSEETAGRIMWPWIYPESSGFSDCSSRAFSRNLERAACASSISSSPLPAPRLLTVIRARRSSRVRFSWEVVAGSHGYALEVYDTSTNSWRLSIEVSGNSWESSELIKPKTAYRWRVRSVGPDGMGNATEWQVLGPTEDRWRSER